ncbi:hypothetical protein [Myxococcus sp. CA056]|uniref:hypothetical protein n=1 Tax=Myxococcus sp. CA056 TaxID=2741740 RepID=UPI0020C6D022|nr:hypothetical protein [Myxococcus sp. CA056]
MNTPRRHDSPLTAVSPPPAAVSPGASGVLDWLARAVGLVVAWVGVAGAVFGVMGLAVGVVGIVSPDEGKKASDGWLVLALAVVFVGVGVFLWKKGMAPSRTARRREQLRGFIRAQIRLRASDAALHLKVSEDEADALLTALIARHEVDLVYLAESREYVHRDALERAQSVASRCPSCDAPVGAENVLPGDKVVCSYCAAPFMVA